MASASVSGSAFCGLLVILATVACGNSQRGDSSAEKAADRDQPPAAAPAAATPTPATPTPAAGAPAPAAIRESVFKALDAVGVLTMDDYHPSPVIHAINLLQPMGRDRGTALLVDYLETRGPAANDRGGLFAVLRVLYLPPPAKPPFPMDACTPRQVDFISGPCVRPPMLGGAVPPPPEQLRSLIYPFFLLGDVPLSLVRGYDLGGEAEPLTMHASSLIDHASGWLAAPLKPKTAGEIRYLFMHYGQWGAQSQVAKAVESQLARLEAADKP